MLFRSQQQFIGPIGEHPRVFSQSLAGPSFSDIVCAVIAERIPQLGERFAPHSGPPRSGKVLDGLSPSVDQPANSPTLPSLDG